MFSTSWFQVVHHLSGAKKTHGLQLFNIQLFVASHLSHPPIREAPGCLHKDVLRKSGSSFSSCAGTNGGIHSSACVCAICGFVKSGKKSPFFQWENTSSNGQCSIEMSVYTPILMSLLHIWGMYIMCIMYTICILLIHPLLSAHSLYPYLFNGKI